MVLIQKYYKRFLGKTLLQRCSYFSKNPWFSMGGKNLISFRSTPPMDKTIGG